MDECTSLVILCEVVRFLEGTWWAGIAGIFTVLTFCFSAYLAFASNRQKASNRGSGHGVRQRGAEGMPRAPTKRKPQKKRPRAEATMRAREGRRKRPRAPNAHRAKKAENTAAGNNHGSRPQGAMGGQDCRLAESSENAADYLISQVRSTSSSTVW